MSHIPPPTLFDLLKWTEQITDWRHLGHGLNVPKEKLDTIEKDIGDLRRRKEEVLDYWIKNDMTASWETLANAIERMGENTVLVQEIRENYCKQVTLPSVAGSSNADSKKNLPKQPKPTGDFTKKSQKRPARDSKKKPQKRSKLVGGCYKKKPTKQPKRARAAKRPKKSKDPEPLRQPSIPEQSLPSSSGIPSTPLLPQPQVIPPQLSIPDAPPQLFVPNAPPQLPTPTASPQLPVPTASPQLPVPNATQTPPPDNPKNTERKRKGKNSGGNDYEKILMSLFVKPEYQLGKAADGYYKYTITHPLFNVTGNECKTDETARQSATKKVIKRLIEKHNHKIPFNS